MKTLRRNFDSFRGATVVSLIPVEWQLREYANIKIGSVGRSEVELLSGLHIECRVPCVELAHGNCLELIGGAHVGHHLLPQRSFARL
jgi:hypothetical protein